MVSWGRMKGIDLYLASGGVGPSAALSGWALSGRGGKVYMTVQYVGGWRYFVQQPRLYTANTFPDFATAIAAADIWWARNFEVQRRIYGGVL